MAHEVDRARSRERVFFDAVLHLHRSLGSAGFRLLMALAALVMLGIGAAFMIVGAWPVLGFCGLEFVLLYVAFRINYRRARAYETVRLSSRGLDVRRFSPRGEIGAWHLEPTWLRVTMDDPPRPESRLTLASHGRSLSIGAFLTPGERLEVAEALRSAIEAYRAPHPAAS